MTTELEVEDELCAFLDSTDLFRVFRQIVGRLLWRPCTCTFDVRADVLLLASRRALAAGWTHGPILIECKRPGAAIGTGISQMLDYLRASWLLPNGVPVIASWAFLYPAGRVHGPLASVLAQTRVGTASLAGSELNFWCGEQRVLTVLEGGLLRVGETRIGRRMGNRAGPTRL